MNEQKNTAITQDREPETDTSALEMTKLYDAAKQTRLASLTLVPLWEDLIDSYILEDMLVYSKRARNLWVYGGDELELHLLSEEQTNQASISDEIRNELKVFNPRKERLLVFTKPTRVRVVGEDGKPVKEDCTAIKIFRSKNSVQFQKVQ